MTQLRTRFIQELSIKGYSKRTVSSYVSSLASLTVFTRKSPTEVTDADIRDYLNHCVVKKNSHQ